MDSRTRGQWVNWLDRLAVETNTHRIDNFIKRAWAKVNNDIEIRKLIHAESDANFPRAKTRLFCEIR